MGNGGYVVVCSERERERYAKAVNMEGAMMVSWLGGFDSFGVCKQLGWH